MRLGSGVFSTLKLCHLRKLEGPHDGVAYATFTPRGVVAVDPRALWSPETTREEQTRKAEEVANEHPASPFPFLFFRLLGDKNSPLDARGAVDRRACEMLLLLLLLLLLYSGSGSSCVG